VGPFSEKGLESGTKDSSSGQARRCQEGLTGEIISRLEKKGLKIVAMRMLQMDKALARKHYAVHDGKPFFAGLVEFITSGRSCGGGGGGEVGGGGAQADGRDRPGQGRARNHTGDYGLDIGENLIHGSTRRRTPGRRLPLLP